MFCFVKAKPYSRCFMIIPPMGKKKKKDAGKCQHHEFYGRVLLTWWFTVQQGNEGISQSAVSPVCMTPKSWIQSSACASTRGVVTRGSGAGVFNWGWGLPAGAGPGPDPCFQPCISTSVIFHALHDHLPQRTMQGAAAIVPILPHVCFPLWGARGEPECKVK